MKLKMYNSMTKSIETFEPWSKEIVSLYTCGPTVYNYAHIGNLRTYIHEDVLEKTLRFLGYQVDRVMNITDVGHLESDADDGQDKMFLSAQKEKKTVWDVANYYTDVFFKDFEKLNINKPEKIARATDYINEYIEFIKVLENKGYTYFSNGNVYFDISKFKDYTKLSKLDLETLKIAHRDDVEEDSNKKNPQDFVLWFTKSKFEKQAMKWDSPWGVGYPGWHIECSVIAFKNLGERLDIHCGGVDHIPIHHTNEIAQTESYTGKKWTKYWWHSEFLIDQSGKMSKSSGDFLTVSLLESKGFDPLSYRYYVLNSHYRKQLAFSFENLEMAEKAYKKLRAKTTAYLPLLCNEITLSDKAETILKTFKDHLSDDLNTPNAITVLYGLLKDNLRDEEKAFLIQEIDKVLSLDLLIEKDINDDIISKDESKYIKEMIEKRREAKKNKDFSLADAIRDELSEKGIKLTDTPKGTTWEKSY